MRKTKKINKGKNFIINLYYFPFNIYVSIDETDEKIIKDINKKFHVTKEDIESIKMAERGQGRCVMMSGNRTVLRIKKQKTVAETASIVTHESMHAINFIMERIGVKFDVETSEEVFTYGTQYLVRNILENMK